MSVCRFCIFTILWSWHHLNDFSALAIWHHRNVTLMHFHYQASSTWLYYSAAVVQGGALCVKIGFYTMEGLCTKHLSFSLLAKNLKKRSFEARSLHILGLSWDKFLILCSTPYLANAFVKLEVEHRIRISKLKDQNHLQMYRGHAGIFSLGNQDPCNSVIMDISKIFLSQKGSISSSKFELFLPV